MATPLELIADIQSKLALLTVALQAQNPPVETPGTLPLAKVGNILTLKSSSGKENVTTGTARLTVGMMVKFANGRSTPVTATEDGITFTTREPAADTPAALKKLADSNLTVESVPGGVETPTPANPGETPTPPPVSSGGSYLRTVGEDFDNLGMGAGADHVIPGREGTNYGLPSDTEIKRSVGYGFKESRVGFLMGRVFKGTDIEMYRGRDPVDATRMMTMDTILRVGRSFKANGATVMWDNHCYGFFPSNGAPNRQLVTAEMLANHWYEFIKVLKSDPDAWAATRRFDLMNEPYTITGSDLANIYQAVIDKCAPISEDKIFVMEGPNYSSAANWVSGCGDVFAKITHPRGKAFLEFSAHCYLDAGYDGYYTEGDQINAREQAAGVTYETIGEFRTKGFVGWLKANQVNGSIGEFNVPGRLPNMVKAGAAAVKYWKANGLNVYWFGMSDWFGDNEHNIELASNKPTFEMLRKQM